MSHLFFIPQDPTQFQKRLEVMEGLLAQPVSFDPDIFFNLPVDLDPADMITAKEAATLLGRAEVTLKKWRAEGKGPPWFNYPANTRSVRYTKSGCTDWVAAQKRNGSIR